MRFWLAIGGESVGPYAVEEIHEMLRQHHVTGDTPAMPEDGEEWTTLSVLPDFSAPPAPPPPPPVRGIPGLERRSALGVRRSGPVPPSTAPATRPIPVAQPSSATPIVIIFVVLAVLAGGGGIFVYQHSQNRKREVAAAEAKAEEQRRAAEAAAKAAAEKAANPAMALAGASREQILAMLKKEAEAIVHEKPFEVDLSTTPTEDTDIAMLRALDDLEVLHLGGGAITDDGLEALSGLKRLRELSLGVVMREEGASRARTEAPSAGQLKVSDAALEELKELKGLHKLYLWNCNITDAGLEILDGMRGLYELELVNTAVSEVAARRFIQEHPQIAVTVRSPGFVIEP